MAALSTAARFTQEVSAGRWQGKRKLCLSASSSSSSSSARLCLGEKWLYVSFFTASPSSQKRRLWLLQVAASKRSSPRQKSFVEEPETLQNEREGDDGDEDEEYVKPELPGEEPDFWEGPQFEILGFIVQYLWAFGVVIALGGCLIAVKYYNEGATDFKETQVYKESMEAQGFLENPSDLKVFDEPPSLQEDAPPVVQGSSS